jgi:hypothetical protein
MALHARVEPPRLRNCWTAASAPAREAPLRCRSTRRIRRRERSEILRQHTDLLQ